MHKTNSIEMVFLVYYTTQLAFCQVHSIDFAISAKKTIFSAEAYLQANAPPPYKRYFTFR